MTPPPAESALPRCSCDSEIVIPQGVERKIIYGRDCHCHVEGPDEQSARAAWSALCAPHALEDSQAECERLRKALAPFARLADAMRDREDSTSDVYSYCGANGEASITIADLIEARAALSTAQQGGEPE